ncbi:MAG TPA: glycosyltransferase family 1 protein [Saprospiraceae bacterium]|nr:glycosyltransferase family 1 protein [Saprospiraceae bacterium]
MSKKIKVLFDYQAFSMQMHGGVSRLFAELIAKLRNFEDIDTLLYAGINDNTHLKEIGLSKGFISNWRFKYKSKVLNNFLPILNKVITRLRLNKQSFEIFVPTYFDPYFLPFASDKPFILPVFDMIHELFPQYFDPLDKTKANKKLLLLNSTKIVAISQSTKNDILCLYPEINPDKIVVIPLANSLKSLGNTNLKLPEKYVLFVGTRKRYKNWEHFIRACSLLVKSGIDFKIVCVGGGTFSANETIFLEQNECLSITHQMTVTDEDLPHVYKNARVFVFPSLYEGFGIPVLEAMENECPVILYPISSFPEVAGDAGVYPKSSSDEDLATSINEMLANPILRQEHITKGLSQAGKFSWKKHADQWHQLILDLVSNKSKK